MKKNKTTGKKAKAIDLVQPNKVTNAQYQYNETQENILTLMIEAIQKHMTKEQPIQTDLFGEPIIRVNVKELGGGYYNKGRVIRYIEDLRIKPISFEWQNEKKQTVKTTTGLISAWHDYKETPFVEITISKWAIPYLLYWGKGVGGTIFSKSIALTLPGIYTKRLYKICKRWEDKSGFGIGIDELREMLMLGNKYKKITDLRKWVLEPAREKMREMADVYFNYEIQKIGGSRKYNYIQFSIHGNNKNRLVRAKTDVYLMVYNMLTIAYPNYKSNKAQMIADLLADDPDKLELFYRRVKRLKNELDSGEKNVDDVMRLIKHIVKEDYNIHL